MLGAVVSTACICKLKLLCDPSSPLAHAPWGSLAPSPQQTTPGVNELEKRSRRSPGWSRAALVQGPAPPTGAGQAERVICVYLHS